MLQNLKSSLQRLKVTWDQGNTSAVLPHLAGWLVVSVLLVGFWLHIAGLIDQDRTRTIAAAENELVNLGRLSQEHAERTFYSADLLLRSLLSQYQQDGDKIDLKLLLERHAFDARLFPQLSIIDAQGNLKYSTTAFQGRIDLSDREHFKVHAASDKDELFISRPVLGRASGKWIVQFTRRITGKDGKFVGVAAASLDPAYFSWFYSDLKLGSQGVAALYRTDGWLFARKSAQAVTFDAPNTSSGPIFSRVTQGETSGHVTSRSIVDGIERTYYFRKLPNYPALVTVGMGTADMLAHHEQTRSDLVRSAFIVSIFLIAVGVLASLYLAIRRRGLAAQAQSEARYRNLIARTPEAIAVHHDGIVLYVNPAAIQLFAARSEQDFIGKPVLDFVHPDCREEVSHRRRLHIKSDRNILLPMVTETFLKLDGAVVDVEVYDTVIEFDGAPAVLTIIRDITERRRADAALRASEQRFRDVAGVSADWIWEVDAAGCYTYASESVCSLLGYAPEEIVGKTPFDFMPPAEADRVRQAFGVIASNAAVFRDLENIVVDAQGGLHDILTSGTPVHDANGQVIGYRGVDRDVTEHKRTLEQIRQLAFFDPLTQLPNRRLLEDRLNQAIAASKRGSLYNALIFLDLDNFKPLNDTHGHKVGDLLLVEVASRLIAGVREVDTVARIGGDEFVVLLAGLELTKAESAEQARVVADKTRINLSAPYLLAVDQNGTSDAVVKHQCSASIGVVVFVSSSPDEVLKCADAAMYQAKQCGRNAIRFYEAAT